MNNFKVMVTVNDMDKGRESSGTEVESSYQVVLKCSLSILTFKEVG